MYVIQSCEGGLHHDNNRYLRWMQLLGLLFLVFISLLFHQTLLWLYVSKRCFSSSPETSPLRCLSRFSAGPAGKTEVTLMAAVAWSVSRRGELGEQRGSVQLFEAEMLKQATATKHSNREQQAFDKRHKQAVWQNLHKRNAVFSSLPHLRLSAGLSLSLPHHLYICSLLHSQCISCQQHASVNCIHVWQTFHGQCQLRMIIQD